MGETITGKKNMAHAFWISLSGSLFIWNSEGWEKLLG